MSGHPAPLVCGLFWIARGSKSASAVRPSLEATCLSLACPITAYDGRNETCMLPLRSAASVLIFASVMVAQPATQPPAVNSPEVHPDGRVTFRIRAPKASEVTFFGDWMA